MNTLQRTFEGYTIYDFRQDLWIYSYDVANEIVRYTNDETDAMTFGDYDLADFARNELHRIFDDEDLPLSIDKVYKYATLSPST